MPEPRDARSIIENAEQAATAGNYASAEELLREAATLHEQTLGPHHPDLAHTLNNLGVVCEMTDNPIDAEHYFRRAYTIAAATLAPDHPFVVTSSKNLHAFCAARGRPVELRPSPPEVAAWLEERGHRASPPRESSPSPKQQDVTPILRKKSLRPLALGVLGGVILLIAILMMTRHWRSSAEGAKSPPATAIAPARETFPQSSTNPRGEASGRPQQTAKPQSTRREADAVSGTPNRLRRSVATPTVVTAQLCTVLREWRCDAADSEVRPGPMFFYTQVKSATATTIEHRWYQGDRLRQAVKLRIQANPGKGYRTYSRNSTSEPVGEWRVELRSADGAVLHEERFTVR